MTKPLYIPTNKKFKGLVVYCTKCQRNISEECQKDNVPVRKCKYGEFHHYKVYSSVPNSPNGRRTKKLITRDYDQAIIEAIQFHKETKEGVKNIVPKVIKVENKKELTETVQPRLLIDSLGRYIGFLNNEGVPAHRVKVRTESHNKDVERILESFVECLNKNGHDLSTETIDDINNDKTAGKYYSYLINEKKFSPRTFNKYLSIITSFFTWYSDEISPVKNYFERIKRRKTVYNPDTISREEFLALLEVISPENGVKAYESETKPTRNLYRPYLSDAFKLALETGRRREEIIQLKFSDIVHDKSGVSYIKIEDFKVNRSQNRIDESERKYILIPLTQSLNELINSLGYEQNKGTDNYLLAPEIVGEHRTTQLSETMSRSFSHYYHIINPNKDLKFGCLRKTYLSQLTLFMGGNAKTISGHSSDAVLDKHYNDKKILLQAVNGFEVFPTESTRESQLQQVRKESKSNERNIER